MDHFTLRHSITTELQTRGLRPTRRQKAKRAFSTACACFTLQTRGLHPSPRPRRSCSHAPHSCHVPGGCPVSRKIIKDARDSASPSGRTTPGFPEALLLSRKASPITSTRTSPSPAHVCLSLSQPSPGLENSSGIKQIYPQWQRHSGYITPSFVSFDSTATFLPRQESWIFPSTSNTFCGNNEARWG